MPAARRPAPRPAAHVDGTPHTDAVEGVAERGADAGRLRADQPVPYGAAYCEEGRVQTIDTLVCEYRDQDALAEGRRG